MDAALDPGLREKLRYIHAQWAHGPKWAPYDAGGDSWFGFDSVRVIEGLDVEIALIPLPGHTRGHCAVAVKDEQGWLLHCGDSYFHHGEMQTPPHAPIGVKAFQLMVEIDHGKRVANQERLRELAAGPGSTGEVRMFCAHDKHELESFA